jgi:hypothetical protein
MRKPAQSSEPEIEKRRCTRIVQAVPLTVTGVDALGRPFQERTSTLIINCQGCRYQSRHYVLKNMWVTLEVPHPEANRQTRKVRARVVWIHRPRTLRELFQVGVEIETSGNFWGISFPPSDWFPFPEGESEFLPAISARTPIEDTEEHPPLKRAERSLESRNVIHAAFSDETSSESESQITRLTDEAKHLENELATQIPRMRAALEKGIEQATGSLRQRAQEISALFATELDRYSRSYLEHTREQLEEVMREGLERTRKQSAEMGSALAREIVQDAQSVLADAREELVAEIELATQRLHLQSQALENKLAETLTGTEQRSIENYRNRLENASNSWLVAAVVKLDQFSEQHIELVSRSTEENLREVCITVLAGMGETLRRRLLDLAAPTAAPTQGDEKPQK